MTEENLKPATAVPMKDQVQYAAGSVVSKTLYNQKTGTLTLFAFSEGQGLSEHTAPFDALVQILDGEGVLTIGGREVRAAEGEWVLMPANTPHALHAERAFKMLLTMFPA